MMAEQPESPAAGPRSGSKGIPTAIVAIAIVAAIVVASVGLGLFPSFGGGPSATSSSSTSATTSAGGGSTNPPALCSGLTSSQELSNAKVVNGSAGATPDYNEQLLLGFEQNFTSSLSYNVTLRAQNDSFGFGPVYLLNGLTDSGYWYQVGVAWNLGDASGTQYLPGFRFVYEVWDAGTKTSVFPQTGGTLPAGFSAADGDVALLSLNMTVDGQVSMSAHDWNTSASASAIYDGFGATQFLGFKEKVTGFPTSLLTEWYHVVPYLCSDEPVVYSNSVVGLRSAWMEIDEWNLTGVLSSQRFNASAAGQCCVFATGSQGVGFQEPATFRSLTTNGTTIYADSHEFVTP
jgi:hypothetical protein